MWKIKGYRGKRTDYRHAFKVTMKPDTDDRWGRANFVSRYGDQIDWCEEHCKGEWSSQYAGLFWFEKRNDALMFKLTWGGQAY
jgi:hypothetical protein